MIILDLIHNIALLVALAVACQVIEARWRMRRLTSQFLYGLLFGAVGVVGMMTPVRFLPGIIFDGRSIILSVGGFWGGPVVALLSALMCGAYRLWLGGAGAAVGVECHHGIGRTGSRVYYWRRRAARPVGLAGTLGLWPAGAWGHAGAGVAAAGGSAASGLAPTRPRHPRGFIRWRRCSSACSFWITRNSGTTGRRSRKARRAIASP